MRIAAADIALDSKEHSAKYREVREQLTEGFVRAGDAFNKDNLVAGSHQETVERTAIAETSTDNDTYTDLRKRQMREDVGVYTIDQLMGQSTESSRRLFELSPEDKAKIELLKKLFENLTGKRFNVGMADIDAGPLAETSAKASSSDAIGGETALNISSEGMGLEYGRVYSFEETITQEQSVQFQAAGKIHTADGKTIDINLELNLSRSLSEHRGFTLRAGAAVKDPLVINFSGEAAELTARTFSFDLDSDGDEELIHQLHEQSGYLALDKNNNQTIDNGKELFGAETGQGFEELAAYDDDRNGFIDENDSIWDKLRIWVQHDDGSSSMFTLAEKGVGALYLGYADTDWELGAGEHSLEMAGKVRATGLFLTEEGETGTLQQVDLVV